MPGSGGQGKAWLPVSFSHRPRLGGGAESMLRAQQMPVENHVLTGCGVGFMRPEGLEPPT
jgi:hypothetical protein